MVASALRLGLCACALVGGLILGDSGAGLASADPAGVGQGSHDRESSKDVNNERPSLNRIIHRILSEHRKRSRSEPRRAPRAKIGSKPGSGFTASESSAATFAESDDEPDPDLAPDNERGAEPGGSDGSASKAPTAPTRRNSAAPRLHRPRRATAEATTSIPPSSARSPRRRRSWPTSSVIRSRTTCWSSVAVAATGGTRTGSPRDWAMPSARSSRRRARQSRARTCARAGVPRRSPRAGAGDRRIRRDRRRWRWRRLSRHRFRRFTRAFGADRRDPDATARCGPLPGIPARRRAGCRCSRCPRRDCWTRDDRERGSAGRHSRAGSGQRAHVDIGAGAAAGIHRLPAQPRTPAAGGCGVARRRGHPCDDVRRCRRRLSAGQRGPDDPVHRCRPLPAVSVRLGVSRRARRSDP